MDDSKSISVEKLNASESEDIHKLHEHIQKIGRARRCDDGKGDFCLRVREDTSDTHVNPVYKTRERKYGLTQYLNKAHVAYAEANQQFRSKFDSRVLVHVCGNPKPAKTKNGKSVSKCINCSKLPNTIMRPINVFVSSAIG